MDDIDLDPQLDGFVRGQVESGRFRDAGDVVRAGLRLLQEREAGRAERRAGLVRQIGAAMDDTRPNVPADAVFDRLERKHAARTGAGRRDP